MGVYPARVRKFAGLLRITSFGIICTVDLYTTVSNELILSFFQNVLLSIYEMRICLSIFWLVC